MQKKLPSIKWNLPNAKLSKYAQNLMENYIKKELKHMTNGLPQPQKQKACKIIMEDIKSNNGQNVKKIFIK